MSAAFTAVVGSPTQSVIDGGRTHHVAGNMAGTGAPSTNTLEIDVFCCSVDERTRPVSCQITLCWTWNLSEVEENCKRASPSSVSHQTQISQKSYASSNVFETGTTEDKQHSKGNVVALESYQQD